MKELTVKQLAAISGVTVRTLHHYDEIGLLAPASVGANGYRFYGRKEQLRLQQILFHRELGVPLSAIAELLDLEAENQIAVLTQHREKLETERERYRALIDTIDHTILDLKGEGTMQNADLYKGFSPEKQAGYEAWLIERYGEPMREDIEHSRKSFAKMSPSEREAVGKELQVLEEALAGCTAQWRRCGSRWRRCPHQASPRMGCDHVESALLCRSVFGSGRSVSVTS
ncbi:MAG: MerR family transcriptional regulator [Steroidobacteraceae bacterium]